LARNVVNLRCGPNFHLIHYPLRNGQLFNFVAVTRVPEPIGMDHAAGVLRVFEESFVDACDEVQALLPLIDRSRYWAISNMIPLDRWVSGNVALIGDAAHAMVQAMAQGACQAVEDAIVLSKHVSSGASWAKAFEAFEAERRLRATYTQYRSLFMWELIHATGGWRDLRQDQLASIGNAGVLPHLDWLYSAKPGTALATALEPTPRRTALVGA
jgi:salicylate hydroxylase